MFELYHRPSNKVFPLTGLIKEIGRSKSADISFPDDKKISRIHARLEKDGEAWAIVDLSSTNGTFVNGKQTDQAKLKSGDEIRAGNTPLIYRPANSNSIEADEPTRVDISVNGISSKIRSFFTPGKNK
jgi:pSer/pThr/pTyr-binding forkhead associated (FHA) protein